MAGILAGPDLHCFFYTTTALKTGSSGTVKLLSLLRKCIERAFSPLLADMACWACTASLHEPVSCFERAAGSFVLEFHWCWLSSIWYRHPWPIGDHLTAKGYGSWTCIPKYVRSSADWSPEWTRAYLPACRKYDSRSAVSFLLEIQPLTHDNTQ